MRRPTRPLLAALALGLTPVAAAPASSAAPSTSAAPTSLVRLSPTDGGVAHTDLALARRLTRGVPGGRRTATLRTTGYSMVGVTWTAARAPRRVAVRWPDGHGGWSRWQPLPRQTDLPSAAEQGEWQGTQAVWTGRHRRLQLEGLGQRPRGPPPSLIDTRPTERGASASAPPVPAATSAAPGVAARRPTRAPEPAILPRRAWGADPSWRNGRPTYIRSVKQVHI